MAEPENLYLDGAEAEAYREYRDALKAFRAAERAAEKILRPAQERFQAAVTALNAIGDR